MRYGQAASAGALKTSGLMESVLLVLVTVQVPVSQLSKEVASVTRVLKSMIPMVLILANAKRTFIGMEHNVLHAIVEKA
jgi:hypothetical protein